MWLYEGPWPGHGAARAGLGSECEELQREVGDQMVGTPCVDISEPGRGTPGASV